MTPPGFDSRKKYPLLLEIHGGPVANYGPRFAAEIQLYAAAGYVVLYANPRGSDSYGGEFGNLIHHAYPGDDYFDLVSGVDAAHYMERSPLSLVGNVKTPTLVMTGEADYRTPISESEQYYQALKLRRVETALVRVPGASHDIAARPSQLIAKVAHVLGWFEKHRVRD